MHPSHVKVSTVISLSQTAIQFNGNAKKYKLKKIFGHHTGSADLGMALKSNFVAKEYQFVKCRPNPAVLWDIQKK